MGYLWNIKSFEWMLEIFIWDMGGNLSCCWYMGYCPHLKQASFIHSLNHKQSEQSISFTKTFKNSIYHNIWKGRKILRISTRPTCLYAFVNSIVYIRTSQNFHSSCSMRYSSWRAGEWIFQPCRNGFPYFI